MIAVALRGMAQRKLRSALTAVAIVLGVAMIAGTYVTTDQIRIAFEDIERAANQGVDVIVTPRGAFTYQQGNLTTPKTLPESLVARVASVPGVRTVLGSLTESGALVKHGKAITPSFAPTIVASAGRPPFDPTTIVAGHQPRAAGEIAVNRKLFDDEHLRLGQRLGVTTRTGVRHVTLVGSFDFADVSSIGGATIIAARLQDMQRWFKREGVVSAISAAAEPGVAQDELARRIQAALPANVTVRTGSAQAKKSAADINASLGGFLTPLLLAFAGAAVLVGAFIIYNTFSITIAQRTREFGLLRALGARRRQILGSVLVEALMLGVIASVLGLLVGLGFARFLGAMFDAAGMGIPRSGMVLAGRTIVVAVIVGIGVTVLAALAPARRAMRVPPVAALAHIGVADERERPGRLHLLAAAAPGLVGLALLLDGLFGSAPTTSRLLVIAAGAVLVFVGVALNARYIVRPLAATIGWPLERLFGMPGLLARENAIRNPARTATTSAALMIGLGLVVFVAILAAGLKASIDDQFDRYVRADIVITGANLTPLPRGSAQAIASVPGVAASVPMLFDAVEVDGEPRSVTVDLMEGMDPRRLGAVYSFQWLDGSDGTLRSLGSGTALIEEQFAKTHHVAVGGSFRVTTPSGGTAVLRAIGEYRDPTVLQGMIVAPAQLRAISTSRDPISYFVRTARGANPKTVQAQITSALSAYPTAKVQSQSEYRDSIQQRLDQLVYLLYALLAMSVVISLFGIANSLFLSIHERTAEFGMLRAVGATRRQVRRIVRYESVITAVLGGILGMAIGILFGWLLTRALATYNVVFAVPAGQLLGFLVMTLVIGVVAASVPARRGARIEILEALHHE